MNTSLSKTRTSSDHLQSAVAPEIAQSIAILERQILQVRGDLQLHVIEVRAIERETNDFLKECFVQLGESLETLIALENALSAGGTGVRITSAPSFLEGIYDKIQNLWSAPSERASENEEILRLLRSAYSQKSFRGMDVEAMLLEAKFPKREMASTRLARLSREYERSLEASARISIWKRELLNSPGYLLHQWLVWEKAHGRDAMEQLKQLLHKHIRRQEKLKQKVLG